MPGTIDAHMREGPALTWFWQGKHNTPFNFTPYTDFGIQNGHREGKIMCTTTMSDLQFCGVYSKAMKT
eukprot:7592979-Ditylum_brightwellii.AAC.1